MRASYRDWLEHQGYAPNTVQAQLHRAGRVEDCYGDLDKHYDKDRLEGVKSELRYSAEDARRSKPNPTKIPFEGDARSNLASYRSAVARYCEFRREAGDDGVTSVSESLSADGRVLGEEARGPKLKTLSVFLQTIRKALLLRDNIASNPFTLAQIEGLSWSSQFLRFGSGVHDRADA